MGKTVTHSFKRGKLAANDTIDRRLMFMKIYEIREFVWPCRGAGYIHVYDLYFQTSSSSKPLGQLKSNLYGAALGRGNKDLHNTFKIFFSRTKSPMILKLGLQH